MPSINESHKAKYNIAENRNKKHSIDNNLFAGEKEMEKGINRILKDNIEEK